MSSVPYFNQVADQWDNLRQAFYSETVREAALAAAGVQTGEHAADIGAGSGFVTEGLTAAGLSVAAVDPSERMLDIMRQKFAANTQITYQLGSAEHLPLSDASVQYSFANMCLHHVETPLEAIREMARILRPGGKLVITDLDTHDFAFLRDEHHDRWMGFQREDVIRWFSEAGLTDVSVTSVGSNCCADSECGTQQAIVSIFLAVGTKPAASST